LEQAIAFHKMSVENFIYELTSCICLYECNGWCNVRQVTHRYL